MIKREAVISDATGGPDEVMEIGVYRLGSISPSSALCALAHSFASLVYQSWFPSMQRAVLLNPR